MFRGACIVAALLLAPARAGAYEFWLHADTIGQAYQLRDFQLVGPDLILGRHIITQTLALRITDVGDFSLHRRTARLPDRGLRISWQSYIRVDHDFGNYTNGQITMPGPQIMDALDVIPELAYDVTGIELMYGYLTLEGLLDDRLRVDVGRVLVDDGWGTTAIDGASGRYDVPQVPIEVSAIAGLRVRANSPLGVAAYELDGTSGAGCESYVAGPTPGTGTWQLIDRNRTIENLPFSSDYAYCPQRDVDQPSIGVTIATHGIRGFSAEVGYRRTWSDAAAIYPDEFGQLPATGIDEERVYARAHGDFTTGDFTVEPYGDARYSILNGVFDRADLGVRLKAGASTLEPAVEYYYPTFDGDSIFNAFSIDATTDVRLGYKWDGKGPWRVTADAWLRKYADADALPELAGGGDAGVQRALGPNWRGSIDALADGGYGGRRVGGTATAAWKPTQLFWLRGRFVVLDVKEDASAGDPVGGTTPPHYVTSSANVSSTYQVAEWAAVHVIGEADRDAIYGTQTRVLAVLDLAFKPEM